MGENVSLIDGHIDGSNTCVICGKDIPEGHQVCIICGTEKAKHQRQIDRIRNMSVEELAEFICGIYDYEYDSPVYNEVESGKHICGDFIPDFDEDKIKQWLESEVTE